MRPRTGRAEGRDPRLLVVVLRGALDGLATVAPVGDPDWTRDEGRGDAAQSRSGRRWWLSLRQFGPAADSVLAGAERGLSQA